MWILYEDVKIFTGSEKNGEETSEYIRGAAQVERL